LISKEIKEDSREVFSLLNAHAIVFLEAVHKANKPWSAPALSDVIK
jgi:hypothetical protein